MSEGEARQIAFGILTNHPNCLRDDEVLDDLICDIGHAIYTAFHANKPPSLPPQEQQP